MAFSVTVTNVNVNTTRVLSEVKSNAFWLYLAKQWQRLIFPLIPMDTGALGTTVNITAGEIEYKVPYAVTVYFADWNWNRNKHPLATGEWDLVAISLGYDEELIRLGQAYIDSGRLNL